MWKANENLFANAGDLAETAEDVAYIAKVFGGDSEIDAQGRVLMPAALRREIWSWNRSRCVWIATTAGSTWPARAFTRSACNRAMANLAEKVKTLEKKGLK